MGERHGLVEVAGATAPRACSRGRCGRAKWRARADDGRERTSRKVVGVGIGRRRMAGDMGRLSSRQQWTGAARCQTSALGAGGGWRTMVAGKHQRREHVAGEGGRRSAGDGGRQDRRRPAATGGGVQGGHGPRAHPAHSAAHLMGRNPFKVNKNWGEFRLLKFCSFIMKLPRVIVANSTRKISKKASFIILATENPTRYI